MNLCILRYQLSYALRKSARHLLRGSQSIASTVVPLESDRFARIQSSNCQYSTLIGPDRVVRSPWEDLHIPEINLCHHVLSEFGQFSNLTALVDGATGKEWTFDQVKDEIAKVGSALTKQGLRKGDVVTIFSPNCPEFGIVYLAVTGIGGIVSCVNPVYTAGELRHSVSHSGSKILFTVPALVSTAKKAAEGCPNIKEIVVLQGTSDGCRPYSDYLTDDGKTFPDNVTLRATEDMAALPFSSGTTGLPKAVMLSHHNIVANLEQLVRSRKVMDYHVGDTFLGVLPFFHIYGQVVVLLCGLMCGCKTVTMPKFDPESYLGLAEKHRASFLHVVPPIVLFLAKHPLVAKYDLSSVRSAFTGAAPCGKETIVEAAERLKLDSFRQGYGTTETSPATHCNPLTKYRDDTVGVAVSDVQYKVVDIESGESLAPGQEGELVVRGPNVMLGYYNNEEATAKTLTQDGWLHTGDIGYYEDDGHVTISDRLKELIKVKGLQVAPAELEALLVTHPKVQDAAVIGKGDERAGELPRAYVVLKPNMKATEQEIKNFVKGKVAPFKELEGGVEFRDEIPKSASGKILRRFLKDELNAKK